MGYTTKFKGTLKFDCEMTVPMLAAVKGYSGLDGRELPEGKGDFTYIDLVLNDDFSGLEWDSGTEKNHGMVDAVNYIIEDMRRKWPGFALKGELLAQGEDAKDRWILKVDGGMAVKKPVKLKGVERQCPECHYEWFDESV